MDSELAALLGGPPQNGRAAEAGTSNGSGSVTANEKRLGSHITDGCAGPENLNCSLAHARAGRPVFPCRRDKTPLVKWRDEASTDPDRIAAWWSRWPDAMPGLPMGRASGLAVLDLDIRPDKDGIAALRDLGLDPDTLSPVSVTTPSGGRHLYFRWIEGVGTSAANLPGGIDVRGEGGYVIAPGAVGASGAYSKAKLRPDDLPMWPEALRREVHSIVNDDLAALLGDGDDPDLWADYAEAKRARDWEPDRIRAALHSITDASERDTWLQIGMALHNASGGNDEGYALWCKWSRRCPEKYRERDQRSTWKNFRRGGVTIASLYQIAKGYGWNPAAPLWGTVDALATLLGESKPVAVNSLITFMSVDDCAAAEFRPYVIKGVIAEGNIACIVAAPGVGKSVLAPSLAYAVAQGRETHGRRTKAGGVFYVAAEDHRGMQDRIRVLKDEHGPTDNLTLVGGAVDFLNEQVAGQGSPYFNMLLKAVEQERPSLIVIDTLSEAFRGLEENSSEGMGRVVHVARALTQWGAAVLLIHHDTKDGQQGLPRGHSVLNGALDVSIHLRKEDDGTVRGRMTKNRNGPSDAQIAFSTRTVEIGRDVEGDAVTAPLCQPLNANALREAGPRLAPSERAAFESIRKMMADRDSLDLVAWKEEARNDLRISAAENPESRRKAIYRALQGLTRAGLVTVIDESIHFDDGIEWQFDDLPEDGGEAPE